MDFETNAGRRPQDVRSSKRHNGYDVASGERMIEVKGTTEPWKNYNWVPLYQSEVDCLKNHPDNFYLYIVKFRDEKSYQIEGFYIVPGLELLNEDKFRIKIAYHSLTPISQRSLSKYLQR